jgi:nucleotide-binding universal stress UspA family protein
MRQPSRIVVGVDFTSRMTDAIRWLRSTFAPESDLVLVRAVETEPIPIYLRRRFSPGVDWVKQDVAIARRQLQAYAKGLGLDRSTVFLEAGRPHAVLLEAARRHKAASIVLGTHADDTSAWRRIGSTTERLLRSSTVPVMVIGGALKSAPRRILVAVDEARVTSAVIAEAHELSRRFGARMLLVHVVSTAAYRHLLSMSAIDSTRGGDSPHDVHDGMREEAARWLRETTAIVGSSTSIDIHIAHGKPSEEILATAERFAADLIVIGQYGAGRAIPVFLGSVVSAVAYGARCPVLVVADRLSPATAPVPPSARLETASH